MKLSRIFLIAVILIMTAFSSIAYAQDEMHTVGYWSGTGYPAFKASMAELGYVEGQNVTYLALDMQTINALPPEEQAAETTRQQQAIIDAQPDVILTTTASVAVAVRQMDGDVPIVFSLSDDPVATGAVLDLTIPGTNSTGIITNRPHERRLQLMADTLPSTDKVLYLHSLLTGEAATVLKQVEAVGADLNIEVITALVTDSASGIEALNNTPEGVDWFFLTPGLLRDADFEQRLDTISLERGIGLAGFVDAPTPSYLIGYGPASEKALVQAVDIIDQVLRGASPNDLPLQTAENFLTVNLDRAAALHVDIPEAILRQATTIVHVGDFALTPTAPAP